MPPPLLLYTVINMENMPKWAMQQERDNQAIYGPDIPIFLDPESIGNLSGIVWDIALETTGKFVHYGIVLGAIVYVCLTEK